MILKGGKDVRRSGESICFIIMMVASLMTRCSPCLCLRHENNRAGSYFFISGQCLGQNPPTIEELQDRLAAGDDRYIQVLRYYSRNIKGSDNYWRAKTQELESWIQGLFNPKWYLEPHI